MKIKVGLRNKCAYSSVLWDTTCTKCSVVAPILNILISNMIYPFNSVRWNVLQKEKLEKPYYYYNTLVSFFG